MAWPDPAHVSVGFGRVSEDAGRTGCWLSHLQVGFRQLVCCLVVRCAADKISPLGAAIQARGPCAVLGFPSGKLRHDLLGGWFEAGLCSAIHSLNSPSKPLGLGVSFHPPHAGGRGTGCVFCTADRGSESAPDLPPVCRVPPDSSSSFPACFCIQNWNKILY